MNLKQGIGQFTEWYLTKDGTQKVRDFVWRDYDNWLWTVKQFATNEELPKITKSIAYQSNPSTGETILMSTDNLCCKGLNKDYYNILELAHCN